MTKGFRNSIQEWPIECITDQEKQIFTCLPGFFPFFLIKQMITPTGRSISVGEQDCRGGAQVGTHLSTTHEPEP